MSDLNTEIKLGANADGVEAGVSKAKRSLADLGVSAKRAGKEATEGISGIGAGGDAAAKRVEAATKNTVASIQRQIAAFEAGGTSSRKYQESLAKLRGIDTNALKPYLDQLDAAKAKAASAALANDGLKGSMGGLGIAGGLASSALAGLAATLSVGAVAGFAKRINDGVDALNDLKDATGSSIELISALEDVALRSGASFDTVSTALIKLNQGLNGAKPGSDTEVAIRAIGLSVSELKDLDPAEAFRQVAVALSGFADDSNKARLVQEIFGKSLKEVAPLLKDLAEKGKLVATVTTEQADAAEKFNKELFALSKNTTDAARALTGPLISALNETIEKFREGAKEGKSYYQVLVDEQLRLLGMKDGPKEYAARLNDIARELESGNIHQTKRNALLREQAAIQAKFATAPATSYDNNEVGRLGRYQKPTSGDPIAAAAAAKAAAEAAKKAAADLRKAMEDRDKLLADLSGLSPSFAQDWEVLTKAYKDRALTVEQLTQKQAALLAKQPAIKAATDAETHAGELSAKATSAAAEAQQKYSTSLSDSLDKLVQDTVAMQEHIDRLGLSKQAVAELDAQKLESQAVVQDLIVLKKIEAGVDADQYEIYVKMAAQLRDQARLKRSTAGREAEIENATTAAKAAADEWQRGWEESDRLARETWADIATLADGAAQRFGKTLEKSALSALYDVFARPFALQLYTSIAGGAPAGVSGLSTLGGAASGASGLSSILGPTGALSGVGTAMSSFTNAAMITTQSLLGVSGTVASTTPATLGGTAIGGSAGIGSGTVLGGGAAAASRTSSLAATLGTVAPYALAALAVFQLLTSKGEYVKSTGSSVQYFDAKGTTTSTSSLGNNFNTPEADAYVKGIKDAYTSATKSLGIANNGGLFAYAANNSDGGKFGVQVGVGSAQYSTGELKTTPEAMSLEAARAVFAALQGSELPKYLSGVFDGLTASTATQDQINSVVAYAQNIKTLHDQLDALPFQNLKDLSLEATKGLIEFAGGLDALGANLAGYYQNYYSAEEQRAQTIKNVTATLNAAGASLTVDDVAGATKEVFRQIVEGQDLTTEAGRKNYAALLSVQGAFASLTTEAKAAATATNDAAAALAAATAANGYLNGEEGRRIDAAQAVVDGLRSEATQQYIDAQMAVVDAQKNLATVLHSTIEGFEDFLDTLDGAQAPTVRLAGARQNFDDLTERARTGDTAAISQLTGSAKTFLDLSKGYSATIQDYRRDEARVRNVLQEGIAAGQKQLLALPVEMQKATDPLKDAYDQLTKASTAEFDARTLAIAMQAKLSTAQTSLKDKYLEAITALPNGAQLKEFWDKTYKTVDDALKISTAAALAAQEMLAKLYTSGGWTAPTVAPPVVAPPVAPPAAQVDKTLHGVGGIAMFENGDFSNGASAADAIKAATEYAAALGKDALLVRVLELGGTPEMLDRLRAIAGPTASFAVGTNYVPEDMLAQIHRGEAIVPAAYNPAVHTQARDEALVAEIRALRAESAKQQETIETLLDTIATQSSNSAYTLRKLDDVGVKTRT